MPTGRPTAAPQDVIKSSAYARTPNQSNDRTLPNTDLRADTLYRPSNRVYSENFFCEGFRSSWILGGSCDFAFCSKTVFCDLWVSVNGEGGVPFALRPRSTDVLKIRGSLQSFAPCSHRLSQGHFDPLGQSDYVTHYVGFKLLFWRMRWRLRSLRLARSFI